jgi:hypothetical protein
MSVKSYEVNRASHEQLGPDGSYCFEHNDCILKHFVESIKANMAAGLVMLRLIPSIVASLGSTIGEMSLLSWRRPVPSFPLSMGAPAIFPSRVMQSDDLSKLLLPTEGVAGTGRAGPLELRPVVGSAAGEQKASLQQSLMWGSKCNILGRPLAT